MNTKNNEKSNLFQTFTQFCVSLMQKYLPDPFIFCVILTFIVFIAATFFTKQNPLEILKYWAGGFWSLLSFSMQMALVLVLGHTMANSPIFKKFLSTLASKLASPRQAIVVVTLVSIVANLISWGFGLVIGALFAREIAKKIKNIDYRLLIASAYSGFIVWHGGLSGSIPLQLASAGEALSKQTAGAITKSIPTSLTIFSPMNIFIVISITVVLPFLNRAMYPTNDNVVSIEPKLLIDPIVEEKNYKNMTPAEKLENSKLISVLLGSMGVVYIIYYFFTQGFDLNLNIVNFIFLFLGVLLHKTPRKFINAIYEATKGSAGVILQFPFYAGIMGIMVGKNLEGISLAAQMSQTFVSISTVRTFPLFSFFSAGIVNFFVPSGGGQWAVQAPIMMPAGLDLGVDTAKTAMAIAWGDAWTNMIQPFWALPALGIAGLGAKDIMGYCLVVTIVCGFIISCGFFLF
ncbi:MAG: short-chain fatty acid transporter [Fusobacteriaceae bacterium]